MTNESSEAKIDLTLRVMAAALSCASAFTNFGFALHRQYAVWREAERRDEEVEVGLEIRRGFGWQWR